MIWGQISVFPEHGEIGPSLASWYHSVMFLVIVLGCLLSGVAWKVGMCFWVTSGAFAVPARLWGFGCALMQAREVPCCVRLLCKQGTGGCRGFGTQTMLCHAPCISPPAAWRGSVPRTSHPLSWGCCRRRYQSPFSDGAVGGKVVFRL